MATHAPSGSLTARLMAEEPASLLLSFIAGFVDTAGFIALGGLFTAHVTGNLVLVGAALAQGTDSGILGRLLMIPIFIVAVALTTLLARYARRRNYSVTAVLLTAQVLAMTLFLGIGVALTPPDRFAFSENAIIIIGGCGVVAMGIQNTLMREGLTKLLPTTVMTGNLTQFTIDLVRFLNRQQDHERAPTKKLRHYIYVLLGFVLGAAAGAYGIATLHFWSMLLPLLLTLLLTIASFAETRISKQQGQAVLH